MARTTVPITSAVGSNGALITATALDPTNGMNIPNPVRSRKLLVRISNTGGAAAIATVRAGADYGAGGGAFRASLGDLAVSITNGTAQIFEIESARFNQSDQSINIDFAAGMTGTIEAYVMDWYAA